MPRRRAASASRLSLVQSRCPETKTDAKGEFTADAPKGAHVTAMKGDLMGDAVIESKEVVVTMREMPM